MIRFGKAAMLKAGPLCDLYSIFGKFVGELQKRPTQMLSLPGWKCRPENSKGKDSARTLQGKASVVDVYFLSRSFCRK